MNFSEARKMQDEIEEDVNFFSAKLKAFPKGNMGLTPDSVKATEEYQTAKRGYDAAFASFRKINSYITKHFSKELNQERKAYRAALQAKHA